MIVFTFLFFKIGIANTTKFIQEDSLKTESLDTVKVGDQIWSGTNLSVITFRNGDTLMHAQTNEQWKLAAKNKIPAWCYSDCGATDSLCGKLYNYYAVIDKRGLAPEGYKIPSKEEYEELISTIGQGKAANLKSTTFWENNGNGNNSSKMNIVPGGYRNATGLFNPKGRLTALWSTTEKSSGSAHGFGIIAADNEMTIKDYYKQSGLSVRCIWVGK